MLVQQFCFRDIDLAAMKQKLKKKTKKKQKEKLILSLLHSLRTSGLKAQWGFSFYLFFLSPCCTSWCTLEAQLHHWTPLRRMDFVLLFFLNFFSPSDGKMLGTPPAVEEVRGATPRPAAGTLTGWWRSRNDDSQRLRLHFKADGPRRPADGAWRESANRCEWDIVGFSRPQEKGRREKGLPKDSTQGDTICSLWIKFLCSESLSATSLFLPSVLSLCSSKGKKKERRELNKTKKTNNTLLYLPSRKWQRDILGCKLVNIFST